MNPWVKYTDRSYDRIKTSLLEKLRVKVPELTDRSPSNLLMIVMDMVAGVAELINYYIDSTARELYLPTARRFSSVLKLGQLVGYKGRGPVAAYSSIKIKLLDDQGLPYPNPVKKSLSARIQFTDTQGQSWETTRAHPFLRNAFSAIVEVRQIIPMGHDNPILLGQFPGGANQSMVLPDDLAQGSLTLRVGGFIWSEVVSLGFSMPNDNHYTVGLDSNGDMRVYFGDGVNGKIPGTSQDILISYWSTKGATGNVPAGSINSLESDLSTLFPGASDIQVENPYNAYAGRDTEGIEEVRRAIPLVARTLYRAVSRQDYLDLAVLFPGVRMASIDFSCSRGIDIYIVADGGGNLTQGFLTQVQNFLLSRSVIGVPVKVHPSGETHIKGKLTITSKFRVKEPKTLAAVQVALSELYSPYKVKIQQGVWSSDIIALIDNLPEVDYLTLDYFYAEPYLRPLASNYELVLDYSIEILPGYTHNDSWKLTFVGDSKWNLYKNNVLVLSSMVTGTSYEIPNIMNIIINEDPGGVVSNNSWVFKTYAFNRDIGIADYSIPVIDYTDFHIEIISNDG
jgi:hypothetical protein